VVFHVHINIDCSLPTSKSAITFNFIAKVGTILGLLAFSFDFAVMGTEFVAKIKKIRHEIGRDLFENPSLGLFMVD
jgi:hypothetical protein